MACTGNITVSCPTSRPDFGTNDIVKKITLFLLDFFMGNFALFFLVPLVGLTLVLRA